MQISQLPIARVARSLRTRLSRTTGPKSKPTQGQIFTDQTGNGAGEGEGETILQLMGSMGLNRGGLTRAVYERSSALAQNRRLVIGSLAFQLDYKEILAEVIAQGSLPAHTELESFHDWAMNNGRVGDPEQQTPLAQARAIRADLDLTVEKTTNGGRFERIFSSGKFMALVRRNNDGRVESIEHHDSKRPWVVNYRDRYDQNGRVRCREYLGEDYKVKYKIFYNTGGGEYLAYWVNPNGYEYRALLFGNSTKQFKDLRAVHAEWLKDLNRRLHKSVMFSDEPATAFALSLRLDNARKVGAIHTTHYANHVNDDGGHKGWVPHYVRADPTTDGLVFFTSAQRDDFRSEVPGLTAQLRVIPHSAPGQQDSSDVHRQPNSLVVVSRLDRDKRIDLTIEAFEKAADLNSKLVIHIYGGGPEESNLKKQAMESGHADSIVFHGFTDEPLKAFAESSLFVMTSKYEGFGLVITESFSVGTPVVAFDVKYGPRELVKTNVNGALVPDGDTDKLARAIISAFTNWDELSRGAKLTAADYSNERWRDEWESFVADLFASPPRAADNN